MTIYNLYNFDALCEALDGCESDVLLTTEDGRQYSWEAEGRSFRSIVASMGAPKLRRLGVKAGTAEDTQHLMDFLMCARKSA